MYILKRGTVCEPATRCEPQLPVEIRIRPLDVMGDKEGDLEVAYGRKDGLSCLSVRVSAYIVNYTTDPWEVDCPSST